MKRKGHLLQIALVLLSLLLISGCSSPTWGLSGDGKGERVITGIINWEDWKKNAGWEDYEASNFTPSQENIELIKNKLISKNITMYVFAGAWCKDSRSEVPKAFKMFTLLGIPPERVTLIGVDRNKKDPNGYADAYSVHYVPTFILFDNGVESGRIVEYPLKSWEEDLLDMIR